MSISLHNPTRVAFYANGKRTVRALDSPFNAEEKTSEVWLAKAEWFVDNLADSGRLDIDSVDSYNVDSHSIDNHHLDNKVIMLNASQQNLQPQQQAVRLLLSKLIQAIGIGLVAMDNKAITILSILDDTRYPYRLTPSNHYVSFSHSQHKVACALSPSPIGIDLETRPIPLVVAQRFFHPAELQWLEALQPCTQRTAIQILWSIKEAFIKKNNVNNLVMGLKVNHVAVAQGFIQQLGLQRVAKTQQTAFIESANSSMALNTAYPLTAFIEQSAQHWYLSLDCNDNFLVMVKDTD